MDFPSVGASRGFKGAERPFASRDVQHRVCWLTTHSPSGASSGRGPTVAPSAFSRPPVRRDAKRPPGRLVKRRRVLSASPRRGYSPAFNTVDKWWGVLGNTQGLARGSAPSIPRAVPDSTESTTGMANPSVPRGSLRSASGMLAAERLGGGGVALRRAYSMPTPRDARTRHRAPPSRSRSPCRQSVEHETRPSSRFHHWIRGFGGSASTAVRRVAAARSSSPSSSIRDIRIRSDPSVVITAWPTKPGPSQG